MGKRTYIGIATAVFGLFFAHFAAAADFPLFKIARADEGLSEREMSVVLRLVDDELIQLDDLGIDNPGILQTNPFYFVKKFRRNTLRAFKVSAVQKAELELLILNEKAAELLRLEEIIPGKSNSLLKALASYEETLLKLEASILAIEGDSRTPEIDAFLNSVLNSSLKHLLLFDQIKMGQDARVKESIDRLQYGLGRLISGSLEHLEKSNKYQRRVLDVIARMQGGAFREFRAAEALGYAQEASEYEDVGAAIVAVRGELFVATHANILFYGVSSTLPAVFAQLPGDAWVRINALDESREYFTDQTLKNDFASMRQLFLDLAEGSRALGKSEADQMRSAAAHAVVFLENELVDAGLQSEYAAQLVAKAFFNLEEADELFDSGNYLSSFGLSSSARASAHRGIAQLEMIGNLDTEIRYWKSRFDMLLSTAQHYGFEKETSPRLYALLGRAEQGLILASDLMDQKEGADRAIDHLIGSKEALLEAGLELDALILKAKEEEKIGKASQTLLQRVLQ